MGRAVLRWCNLLLVCLASPAAQFEAGQGRGPGKPQIFLPATITMYCPAQTLAQIEEEAAAERAAAEAKEAAKKAAASGKGGLTAEEKARLKVGNGRDGWEREFASCIPTAACSCHK